MHLFLAQVSDIRYQTQWWPWHLSLASLTLLLILSILVTPKGVQQSIEMPNTPAKGGGGSRDKKTKQKKKHSSGAVISLTTLKRSDCLLEASVAPTLIKNVFTFV